MPVFEGRPLKAAIELGLLRASIERGLLRAAFEGSL